MRDYKHCTPQTTYTLSEALYNIFVCCLGLIALFALMAELFLMAVLLAPVGAA